MSIKFCCPRCQCEVKFHLLMTVPPYRWFQCLECYSVGRSCETETLSNEAFVESVLDEYNYKGDVSADTGSNRSHLPLPEAVG